MARNKPIQPNSTNTPGMPGSPGKANCQWWVDTGNEDWDAIQRGQRLSNVASTLWRVQEPLRHAWLTAWRLYTNQPIQGLGPKGYKIRSHGRYNAQGLNLCRAVTDSYVALITKDRPRSFFDVVGADRKLKTKAKHLQSFIDGISYETRLEEKQLTIVRDTAIFGEGIVKIFRSDECGSPRVAIERRKPWCILVDEQEAASGWDSCDNIYEIEYVDRLALMARFPEFADRIRLASSSSYLEAPGDTQTDTNFQDTCVTVEAWHKPRIAGPDGSRDGRHTLIVGSLVLADEEWDVRRFPLEFCYMNTPIQGVYESGIPNEIAPQQFEINRIMRTISKSQRLSVGHWMVETNSDVDTNAIDDIVASIVRYSGVMPEYVVHPGVTEDVYAYLWQIWAKGFEVKGLSQLASMAQVPQTLKSSVAIETYADVGSDRQRVCYREYQNWNLRVTEQILHVAREISEEDPSFEVKSTSSKSMMKTVRAADVLLKDEEFNLKIREVNALGEDVSSKLQTVSDLTSAGLIDGDSGKRMLIEDGGVPDLQEYESLEASSYNFVEFCVDKAIDDDEYVKPNIFVDDLSLCVQRMRKFYLKAQMDGVEDTKLKLLRQWMTEAADLKTAMTPPAPPPMPGAPPGLPKPGGPLALAGHMAPPPAPPMG